MADPSDSDSDWETDDSEPRAAATCNSNQRGNTSARNRQQARRTVPPSFDMSSFDDSPFGDSALGDFMYGLEANGFGSMLSGAGIPPMGFNPLDFLDDGNFDDEDEKDEDCSSGSSSSDGPSDDSESSDDEHSEEEEHRIREQELTQKTENVSLSAASTAEEKSMQAHNHGNDLYRRGLFGKATKAYFEALSLTPDDPAPLSNLSAVQFELGNYSESILYAEKALKLLQSEANSSPKKQKLFLRLVRAQVLQLQDATPLVTQLASLDSAHDSATMIHSNRRQSVSWSKVLDEIPRYRPSL